MPITGKDIRNNVFSVREALTLGWPTVGTRLRRSAKSRIRTYHKPSGAFRERLLFLPFSSILGVRGSPSGWPGSKSHDGTMYKGRSLKSVERWS